jgi:hypothetical protein
MVKQNVINGLNRLAFVVGLVAGIVGLFVGSSGRGGNPGTGLVVGIFLFFAGYLTMRLITWAAKAFLGED